MKYFLSFVIFLHGAIHLLGFLKAFEIMELDQLTLSISKPAGVFWLVAFLLFIAAGISFVGGLNWWFYIAILAIILSTILIIPVWADAKFGSIANGILFIYVMVFVLGFTGCKSVEGKYISEVKTEFQQQRLAPEEILTEQDIAHLPLPVQKYLKYTGAIGKSKIQNLCIEFDANMIKKPGDKPMKAYSKQYNFYENYSRLFLMKANLFFIPFRALHIYENHEATFKVRVANLFNVVDISGKELTTAETVTLLNDMCIFAPAALIDNRLKWEEIDSLSTKVMLENGQFNVSAILHFNTQGELINFVSDDRSALQDDGTLRKARWSTPIKDYMEIGGRKIPTYGETIWNYPEGDFTYGTFNLKSIQYNCKEIK